MGQFRTYGAVEVSPGKGFPEPLRSHSSEQVFGEQISRFCTPFDIHSLFGAQKHPFCSPIAELHTSVKEADARSEFLLRF